MSPHSQVILFTSLGVHKLSSFVEYMQLDSLCFVLKVKIVYSSTTDCSGISHFLPQEIISTEIFLSHLWFVKVFTEPAPLWIACLSWAKHISQAVGYSQPTHLCQRMKSSSKTYSRILLQKKNAIIAHCLTSTQCRDEKSCTEALRHSSG